MLVRTILVTWLAAIAGCTELPATPNSKITVNGLDLSIVARHMPELARIAASPLAGSTDAAALVRAGDGRSLLEYVARCALADGEALEVGGVTLDGAIGLAPEWRHAPCDASCQRWISACVLAHANEAHVAIQLRADHPALGIEAADGFTDQEAAFYGDIFDERAAEPGNGVPAMHACAGRGLNARVDEARANGATREEQAQYLLERLCGIAGCGLVPTGSCNEHVGAVGIACDRDAGPAGAFSDCHSLWGRVHGWPPYREVITVYLRK